MQRFNNENNKADLDREFLVVGEGIADIAFIEALLVNLNIRDRFYLGFPAGKHPGKDGFWEYLQGLRLKLDRATSRVRKILLLRDSDDDPSTAFTNMLEQIEAANEGVTTAYSTPQAVRQPSNGKPSITVVTIPFDKPGCLETLLLGAADDGSHQLHDCFSRYWECTHFDRNSLNVASKQKLTTIIAASNINNPSCTLAAIWSEQQRRWNPMLPDHEAFRVLSEYLVLFAEPELENAAAAPIPQ